MFRRVVAASFVVVWLVLLGIEFSEDTGLFEYDDPGMDKSVEGTLASLGEAIKVSDEAQVIPSHTPLVSLIAFYPSVTDGVLFLFFREETKFIKIDIPIYKLHCTFLI